MPSDTCDATSTERLEQESVAEPTEARRPAEPPRDTTHDELKIPNNPRTNISCLPNELLINIFSEGPSEVLKGTPPFPITISHVSRHWRFLSLNTPSLWARIHTHPRSPYPYPLP
ncbi:hypothetical protein PLICRDRAFT_179316 [Plicaturopsis crispa FD-325 SS-3]|uniref:F-box domain-containing protein n=1 Tax=Plicaturopsis crispa FD-325 SS-3 TaxID=944288 RepID=A0A0C9SXN0_PLICR|nr:hypothetical protein PLICRDRAFT_179316 [Plicaturopsis crispa FD-325 SS-3]